MEKAGVCDFCMQRAPLLHAEGSPSASSAEGPKLPSLGQGWTAVLWRDKEGRRNAWFRKQTMLIQRASQQKTNLTK